MGMTEAEFIDGIARYAMSECSAGEEWRLREHVIAHPEYLSVYFSALRRRAMLSLGINTASDPFHSTAAVLGNVAAPAGVTAKIFVRKFFSDKNFRKLVPNRAGESTGDVNRTKTTNDMNTVNITKETLETISARARKMMENADTEKSTFDNMVLAMVAEEPAMSVDDAVSVCRGLLEGVTGFDKIYAVLNESKLEGDALTDDVYNRCMAILDSRQLSPAEQAAILTNFIALAKYADAASLCGVLEGDDVKEFSELLAEETRITGEVTPEHIDALKAQFKEAIANSSIVLTGETELRRLVDGNENGASVAEGLAARQRTMAEYKSYCAVAAYIEARKGNIEGCDANVDATLLGTSVAAGIEREEIMEGVKTGTVSVPLAVKLLKYIAGALLTAMFIWVAYKLVLITMGLSVVGSVALLGEGWAAIAAGVLIGGYASYKAIGWFTDKVCKPITEGLDKAYDTVVSTILSDRLKGLVADTLGFFVSFLKETWKVFTGRSTDASTTTTTV